MDGCPKSMTYGPCGGVRTDGACEVPGVRCPFVGRPLPVWPSTEPAAPPTVALDLPTLLIDVRSDPADDRILADAALVLREVGAAALLGEHLDDAVPGSLEPARALVAAGVPVVATLTARDRTPDETAEALEALIAAGADAVHTVTGDHPAARFGAEATASFGLDGTMLAAEARRRGAAVTVAESPAAPPVADRPARVRSKELAGAGLVILNHGGSAAELIDFADRCREAGVTIPLAAPVPVVTDHRSARALTQFPGVALPPGLLEAVLEADDPERAGVDAAVHLGSALLDSGRFAHLDLSGSGSGAGRRHEVMAAVATRLV